MITKFLILTELEITIIAVCNRFFAELRENLMKYGYAGTTNFCGRVGMIVCVPVQFYHIILRRELFKWMTAVTSTIIYRLSDNDEASFVETFILKYY